MYGKGCAVEFYTILAFQKEGKQKAFDLLSKIQKDKS